MDISQYLRRVARGKNGAEHLERHEAAAVLAALFAPQVDALQLGAFLIAERMKGESSRELAGFVDASRQFSEGYDTHRAPRGAVDMPCYAGKCRAAPVHLLAALKARDAGIPVLVHGIEHIAGRLSAWTALQAAGVRRAASLHEAAQLLAGEGLVYIDLAELCPPLFALMQMRPRLGVRSFAHTVARLLNPLRCDGQLNGVFHTPYVALMAEANVLLEQKRSLVFMGAEGDPELYADRQKLITAQEGPSLAALDFPPAQCDVYPRQSEHTTDALLSVFSAMSEGRMQAREQAAMHRMLEAFHFAASGVMPQDWSMESVIQNPDRDGV